MEFDVAGTEFAMAITEEMPTRKNLSADALFALIHRAFQKIPDHRPPFAQIPLT